MDANEMKLFLLNARLHALEELFLKLHPEIRNDLEQAVVKYIKDNIINPSIEKAIDA